MTLRQKGRKFQIQTKDIELTGDKVLNEVSAKLNLGGSSKDGSKSGDTTSEINKSIAGEIAGKHAVETSKQTGHDEMRTFEFIWPPESFELAAE